MAIDKAIYVPLFTETSVSMESPFFTVFPGNIAMLQGFGFMEYAAREDNSTMRVPQYAYLEMLLFKEGTISQPSDGCPIRDLSMYQSFLLAKEPLRKCGCMFELSKKNNIMLLNIPGSYRLIMNDMTAVGNARVYLRTYSKTEFPWNSKFFLGE